ncbi:MAG: hypothetical protein AAFQ98_26455, partial [Bacteroidota bacterium]
MKKHYLVILAALVVAPAMAQSPNPTQLLADMEEAVGGWDQLYSQRDVQFVYNYEYVGAGKKDVSEERYIFEGEHSWAKYTQHDINVMPGMDGDAYQTCVFGKTAVMYDGEMVKDPQALGGADFLRRANYFWFTMF